MKAQRIGKRLANSSFSAGRAKLLADRYAKLSERAAEQDKELADTLHKLNETCEQEWIQGMGAEINLSPDSLEVSPTHTIAIAYIPKDSVNKERIESLINLMAKNKAFVEESERRAMLLQLANDDSVKSFFDQLKESGDFQRFYLIYKAAILLQQQEADPKKVSEFIRKKLSGIVGGQDCNICQLAEASKKCLSATLMFDVDSDRDLYPRLVGKDKREFSEDQPLTDALIAARKEDGVFQVLLYIASSDEKDRTKEAFDKLMEKLEKQHHKS